MALALSQLQIIGDTLAIAWSDGEETFLPLATLRKHCPCATCAGEPDVMGNVAHPESQLGERSLSLRGWQMIGGYAWQPTWQDGHNTGLYSFDYLRRLAAFTTTSA